MTNHPRAYFLSALLSLALSLILFKPIFAQPESFASRTDALALIDAVNTLRAENNLPPYQVNAALMIVAQEHADYIAKTGVVTHFNAEGLRPHQRAVNAGYSVAGDLSQGGLFYENIDSGSQLTPAAVIEKWLDDSINIAALLSPDLKDAGAGVVVANSVTYYVFDAGSALEAAELTSAPTSMPTLPIGAVITSTPLEDGSIYHVVQPKEALWSIALAYQITIEDLKRLNRLSADDIYEGQKLLVYKPKAEDIKTPTLTVAASATFGIPTSTATQPVTPTITFTPTPLPTPPASTRGGGMVVGAIVLIALLSAGIGSWLGSKKRAPR